MKEESFQQFAVVFGWNRIEVDDGNIFLSHNAAAGLIPHLLNTLQNFSASGFRNADAVVDNS